MKSSDTRVALAFVPDSMTADYDKGARRVLVRDKLCIRDRCRRSQASAHSWSVAKKTLLMKASELGEKQQVPPLRDFFIFRCNLRPESFQEHLPTSIAGVLRLRAIKPSVCDRSAKRFAQDDGFVGGA
jgi:hypothetical protein